MPINPEIVGVRALQREVRRITQGLKDVGLQQVRIAWARAAAEFVRASVRQVLTDTGMSAATYIPLSQAIASVRAGGTGGLENLIRSRVRNPGRLRFDRPEFPRGQRRRPRPRKRSFGEGEREGKNAYRLNFGRGTTPLAFSFQTVVFQFAYWEFRQRALAVGEAAFRMKFNEEIENGDQVLEEFLNGRRIRSVLGVLDIGGEV